MRKNEVFGLKCTSCVVLGKEDSYIRMNGCRAVDGSFKLIGGCRECGWVTDIAGDEAVEALQKQMQELMEIVGGSAARA